MFLVMSHDIQNGIFQSRCFFVSHRTADFLLLLDNRIDLVYHIAKYIVPIAISETILFVIFWHIKVFVFIFVAVFTVPVHEHFLTMHTTDGMCAEIISIVMFVIRMQPNLFRFRQLFMIIVFNLSFCDVDFSILPSFHIIMNSCHSLWARYRNEYNRTELWRHYRVFNN